MKKNEKKNMMINKIGRKHTLRTTHTHSHTHTPHLNKKFKRIININTFELKSEKEKDDIT